MIQSSFFISVLWIQKYFDLDLSLNYNVKDNHTWKMLKSALVLKGIVHQF